MILSLNHTAWDFKTNPPRLALLPLAACEPHGSHLPLGTDQIIMDAVARGVADRLDEPVFLLPVWPYGSSLQHVGQAGAISLGYQTLWAVVSDVVGALAQHGIGQVAVLNNHGAPSASTSRPQGNAIVKTAVRQLNYETPGLTAIWVQPFAAGRDVLSTLFRSASQDLHAGAIETALMLHLAPERVASFPPDHVPDARPAMLDFAPFARFAPEGVWGRPGEATAEKGAQAFDAIVTATAEYIRAAFTQLAGIKASGEEDR